MILTLAWKEYREHRSVWLTMVLLTGLLAFGLARSASAGDAAAAARLGLAVLGLAAAYGVVCGAMMLAGERESGTLVFLDIFLGRRGLLWLWKCLLGVVLAVSEALAVALVLHLLQERPPGWLPALVGQGSATGLGLPAGGRSAPHYWFSVLPVVTLEAYAWGLLGSALTRRVLSGAGLAVVISAFCWLLLLLAPPPISLALRLLMASGALVISHLVFQMQSRDTPLRSSPATEEPPHLRKRLLEEWERDRNQQERRAPQRAGGGGRVVDVLAPVAKARVGERLVRRDRSRPAEARSPGQVLLWLTFGQAWVLLGALAGVALLVGLGIPGAGQVLWPVATLFLGVACGTATFAQEQSDLSYQFLAAQHFPLKTVWRVKILFWSVAAVLLSLLLIVGGALTVLVTLLAARRPGLLQGDGPAQIGFAFGTLRQLMGPVLFFGVWLAYGFCMGQVFVLLCRKSVLAVLLAAVVGAAALGLWLPSLLCRGMSGWQLWVPPLVMLAATRSLMRAWAGGRIKERKPLAALTGFGLAALAWVVLLCGFRAWEIPDLGEPLDRAAFRAAIPTGKDNLGGQKCQEALAAMENPDGGAAWLARLTEASQWRVGVIESPRGDGQAALLRHLPSGRQMTDKLRALAQAALAEGEPGAAVDHLARILVLSRNLRNKAPLASYLAGVEAEEGALQGLDLWLAHARPAPNHLQRILGELNRHANETPPPLDCLQTECYRAGGLLDAPTAWAFHGGAGAGQRVRERWLADGIALALQTPWEDERKTRLWRAVWEGLLRAIRTPYWQLPQVTEEPGGEMATTREILRGWLPAADGPGASVTAGRLARLLDDSWLSDVRLFAPVLPLHAAATRAQWRVDAGRLAVALGLYQLREKKPAQRLEDLVPNYLPKLPQDPYSGQPFHYRISKGEQLEIEAPGRLEKRTVQPGQGILWSTGPDRVDHGGRRHREEMPEGNPQWLRGDFDLVTVIPHWP